MYSLTMLFRKLSFIIEVQGITGYSLSFSPLPLGKFFSNLSMCQKEENNSAHSVQSSEASVKAFSPLVYNQRMGTVRYPGKRL